MNDRKNLRFTGQGFETLWEVVRDDTGSCDAASDTEGQIQVSTLWTMQNGFLDDVPVDKIKDFQLKLQDYFGTRKDAVLAKIRDKGAIDDEIAGELKAAVGDFKAGYV